MPRWIGLVGVVAGGLVCCGSAASAGGIDANIGLAIGIPAAAGIFGVILRIWPSKATNGNVNRKEYREDIQGLHRRITDETVSLGVCQATREAICNRLNAVENKLDRVLEHMTDKPRGR